MIPASAKSYFFVFVALFIGVTSSSNAQQPNAVRVDTLWATVHDHRLAFFAAGDTAAPAVILEPGGASHSVWGALTSEIAQFARVITYDRPGYGLSESCSRTRSASVIAEELHKALTLISVKRPIVMGGWSLGGSFVRVFGALYPNAVAGLVLIDPAPEHFYERAARERPDVWIPMLEQQKLRIASRGEGHRAEWAAWDNTMAEARQSDAALTAPVILLTATKADDELQPLWIDEHTKWAQRMPNIRHVLVEGAGHAIYRDKPEAVLLALKEMVARARH